MLYHNGKYQEKIINGKKTPLLYMIIYNIKFNISNDFGGLFLEHIIETKFKCIHRTYDYI